ncbi:copper resistance protein B [soil metagenome]
MNTAFVQPRSALLMAAIVLALAAPVCHAQAMDHAQMNMPMPATAPAATPAPAPALKNKKKPTPATAPVVAPTDSMQGMDHSSMPGMDHSNMPGMDHAALASDPTLPRTPIPELTDADRAAARPPAGGHAMHNSGPQWMVLADQLETWDANPGRGLVWRGQAWIGGDTRRLWLRSEGERIGGRTEHAELEVLLGRAVSPWWTLLAGVRHDTQPGGARDFAALGIMGMAPYKFEVGATAYAGSGGQTALRLEAEYELLFTNRLILQPHVEVNAYGRNDAARDIGAGLATAEAGLRLRYEVTRRFAPYIGVVHERTFGNTAELRRAAGEATGDTRVVAGLRFWF